MMPVQKLPIRLVQRCLTVPSSSLTANVVRKGSSASASLQTIRQNHHHGGGGSDPACRPFSASTALAFAEEKHVAALILGKPGGGKGTISGKILNDFPDFFHLSTGDLLRQHVLGGTALGNEAKTHMNAGGLVPDDLIVRLVLDEAHGHYDRSLLLDGFPRTMDQAQALEEEMHVDLVINLDIPTETIVERISDRWIHARSGRVYSYSYKPPETEGIDDVTGEPLTQREDDRPEQVRKRLEAYDQITAPLVEYYERQGVLQTFQGTMSDIIYPDVNTFLTEKMKEAA